MANSKKRKFGLPHKAAIVLVLALIIYCVILLAFSGVNATYLKEAFKYFLCAFSFGAIYHSYASVTMPFVVAFLSFWVSVIVAIISLVYFIKNKKTKIGAFDLLVGAAIVCFSICFYDANRTKLNDHLIGGASFAFICILLLVLTLSFLLGIMGYAACFKDEMTDALQNAVAPAIAKAAPAPVEEKKEEPVEEPKEEEKPVEEEKVEEPVKEEEPAEEPAKEEEPVEEPAAPAVEGEARKIERVPFADKLRKSERDLKNKYDELKAYFESYGLKNRISVDGDSYRLHKVLYVQITIAGKKMKVYFKLNPNDYLTSPIPVKDASKVKKYADIPAQLDVRSDLSVKRAKELFDTVMEEAGIEKAE